MLHLVQDNIHLNEESQNKSKAINKIGLALVDAGFVEKGYIDGMFERENQAATYLGIGIAIPHGTPATRNFVKKTGVQVFCFPKGVVWGDDGEKAYLAIGIAASSDEHLELLRQLTHVLGEEGVEEKIKNIKSTNEAISILTGKDIRDDSEFNIDNDLFILDISADNLLMLQTLNCSRLKQKNAVNTNFIVSALDKKPYYLGDGVWVNDSQEGNLKNAIAISRTKNDLQEEGKPVKVVITISAVDEKISYLINKLAYLAFKKQLNQLIESDAKQLITILEEKANAKQALDTIGESIKNNLGEGDK